jgi:hypothetical protein
MSDTDEGERLSASKPSDASASSGNLPVLVTPARPGRPVREVRDGDGLTPRQRRATEALMQEPNYKRAALVCGVNERTLRRWMKLPEFTRAYHAARRDAFGQSIGMLQRYSPMAVQTLVKVMTDAKTQPASQLAAAIALLRFARDGIELDDLALRLATLETQAMQAPDKKPDVQW